jgi:hypothetical protein
MFGSSPLILLLIDKSSRFGQDTWSLNSLHNLYYLQYSIHMNDFIIIDTNEKKGKVLKNKSNKD